jgi:hypothetical protein
VAEGRTHTAYPLCGRLRNPHTRPDLLVGRVDFLQLVLGLCLCPLQPGPELLLSHLGIHALLLIVCSEVRGWEIRGAGEGGGEGAVGRDGLRKWSGMKSGACGISHFQGAHDFLSFSAASWVGHLQN